MEDDSLQLRDLVPAEPFIQSPGWPWWAWLVIALAIIVVMLLVRAAYKRKESPTHPDLNLEAEKAFQVALKRIQQTADLAVIQEAATACSEAIRRYLATVTGDPSLFETHEEFVARHEALEGFPLEVKNSVSMGFDRLATLKYGKTPKGDPATVADEGRGLLEQLHQHRPA